MVVSYIGREKMNIILTFIEICFMLMIYHTLFIRLDNNIKKYILRSFIGGLICVIFISVIGQANIYVNLSILVMCILITSKIYKKKHIGKYY